MKRIVVGSIQIKILDQRLFEWGFPAYGSAGAAGLDLYACLDEKLILKPHQPAVLVSSGIAIDISSPEWCGLVLPRSGAAHLQGLVLGNTAGVIDSDYRGPCYLSVWNRNPVDEARPEAGEITVAPGDRIAQLLLVKISRPNWKVVDELSSTPRDKNGFGSSGR